MMNLTDLGKLRVRDVFRKLVLSWLFAATLEYTVLTTEQKDISVLTGVAKMSFSRLVLVTLIGFAVLVLVLRTNYRRLERILIFAVFLALGAMTVTTKFTSAFAFALLAILAVLLVYALKGYDGRREEREVSNEVSGDGGKMYIAVTAALAVAFFIYVSVWTVLRVLTFTAPTFDFGLFSQMFYNMKTSFSPMTTLERDGLLSHFAVHVSPIYYLILPVYMLFPYPATLQIAQAAILASAVIPLWLIGKRHGLSPLERTLISLVFLAYPALSGGASYDIHENCFLAPLVLWLLYAIDVKKPILAAVFAILTLCVKEDAAVYVAIIALWLIIKSLLASPRREWRGIVLGGALLAVSLAWFFAVTSYLANHGDGVMTYRYKNFITGESDSLLSVVKTVLLCPLKAVFESVDPEKQRYIILTLAPILALPVFTRKYERYILLIPYVLVNLMSDYQYQHDVFFQYSFGSLACLFYLTLVNISDIKNRDKKLLSLSAAAIVSVVCFSAVITPTASYYTKLYNTNRERYEGIQQTLSLIPDDASVTATTTYTTFFSQREVLYDVKHSSKEHMLECEYVVLKKSATSNYKKYATTDKNGYDNLVRLLEQNGYELFAEYENELTIWRKTAE